MLFSHPSVEAITWWNLTDRHAWMQAPSGLLDKEMSPKPAYKVLKKLIREDWWTEATLTTDANGRASFRGFCGQYELDVTALGGERKLVKDLEIERSPQQKTIQWMVKLGGEKERL